MTLWTRWNQLPNIVLEPSSSSTIFGFSPQAEMTVAGVDRGHYLHIRLYLKLPGRGDYFCLNDALCEKKIC